MIELFLIVKINSLENEIHFNKARLIIRNKEMGFERQIKQNLILIFSKHSPFLIQFYKKLNDDNSKHLYM